MIPKALVAASLKPIILSLLAHGEAYGYQIIQRIETLSGGKLQWTAGTMYPVLHRLETFGPEKRDPGFVAIERVELQDPLAPVGQRRAVVERLLPFRHRPQRKQPWLEWLELVPALPW